MAKFNLDQTDIKILSFLMEDAKMPYTDIAKALSISSGTIHVRIKKLEEMGIIKSSNLHINQDTMGFDITAFLGIYLSKSSKYNVVAKELEKISEVIELNYTTGMYSMFIKVVCKDTKHLRDLLHDKIQQIEDITRTETFIVLEESINRPIQLDAYEYPE